MKERSPDKGQHRLIDALAKNAAYLDPAKLNSANDDAKEKSRGSIGVANTKVSSKASSKTKPSKSKKKGKR